MKETTKNNIVRYAISAAFILTFLIVTSLICIGLDWLTYKTGLPIYPATCIIGLVYVIWYVGGKIIIDKSEGE